MLAVIGWIVLAAAAPSAASLSDAGGLYEANKVAEAEAAYATIATDAGASIDDRSAALRELARIAWLVDGNESKALAQLDRAVAMGGKPCDTAVMTARVLHEAQSNAQAIVRETRLLQACAEADQRDVIRIHAIGARLDLAAAQPGERARLLAEAVGEGAQLSSEAGVEGARVRLETALLTDRADVALAAWKDYFWLDDADAPQAMENVPVAAIFRAGLAAQASSADRLALADLLMRAGFMQQSRRYCASHGLPGSAAADPIWKRLEAYWRERDTLDALVLRINRGLARGKRDDAALANAAKAATIALMQAAGATGDPQLALRQYYGLVGTVGATNGYPSIHMGHVIEDHRDRVTQYGHSADIHFIAIDNMVSNGFTSWLWDGSAMVGGWTANGTIVHIRPGYVDGPLRAWRQTQDSRVRRDLIARQGKRAAEDIAKLKARPVATLEGLNDRLQLQLVDQVHAGAMSRAASDADVRRLFLAEYSRGNLNQSIRVHEGRHAIDNSLGIKDRVDQAVLEYRAKLSELALTAYPRMALVNMNRALEGEGPHDRAAARIFDEYRRWMEAHRDQVVGFDAALPALEQFDKLTDGQIREIARGLDPLARGITTADPGMQAPSPGRPGVGAQ